MFEVLSESTQETDLIDKNREYTATPSILRCVVLRQTLKAAVVFARREDSWIAAFVSGNFITLDLPEIGVAVPLHEIRANAGLSDTVPEGPSA